MRLKLFRRKVKDTFFGNTSNTALDIQLKEMADARMGATYMLAKTRMEKVPSYSIDLVGAFGVDTTALSDLKNGCTYLLKKTDAGQKVMGAMNYVGDKVGALVTKLKSLVAGFFQHMIEKIKGVYGHALYGLEWISEFGIWAVSEFAGNLSSLIPGWGYVQSAADVYAGARTAVLKAKDFVTQMWSGYGVSLLGGHPSIIANALARHSAAGFVGGVKDMAIGATKIGLEAAGDAVGAAGTIVAAVTGVLQRIANLVDYIIQSRRVNSVFSQAEKEWNNRVSQSSMVHDHKAFSEWFQNSVVCTPVIAAVTMGSGFVANPMRFLQLIHPGDRFASQTDFNKGVHHIETLKKLSGNYVQEYTEGYSVKFKSDDGLVKARLEELQEGKGVLEDMEIGPSQPQSSYAPTVSSNTP